MVKVKAMPLTQDEAEYVVESPEMESDIMCATCRFFTAGEGDAPGVCLIVRPEPEPIVPDGYCSYHTPLPSTEDDDESEDEAESSEEETAEFDTSEQSSDNEAQRSRRGASLSNLFRRTPKAQPEPGFKAFGGGVWMATFTNDFKDREGEILASKAHDAYVARVQAKLVEPPELWFWHTPGTRIGKAFFVGREGHFTYALGTFDNTPQAQAAEKFYLKTRTADKLSHGFEYPKWALKNNVYAEYNTFEISLLPDGMEANEYTAFTAERIKAMPLTEEQKAFIEKRTGKAASRVFAEIQTNLPKRGKQLEGLQVEYKDFSDLSDDKPAARKQDDGAFTALMGEVLEAQEETASQMDKIMDLLSAMDKRLTASEKAFQTETAEMKKERLLAPKRVDQSPVITDKVAEGEIDMKSLGDDIWENKAFGVVKPQYAHLLPKLRDNGK